MRKSLLSLFLLPALPLLAQSPTPADKKATDQQFLRLIQTSCVRCHKDCKTLDAMVANNWIVPGYPAQSLIVLKLSKDKKKQHIVSEETKTLVRDFIANYKPAEPSEATGN